MAETLTAHACYMLVYTQGFEIDWALNRLGDITLAVEEGSELARLSKDELKSLIQDIHNSIPHGSVNSVRLYVYEFEPHWKPRGAQVGTAEELVDFLKFNLFRTLELSC